MGATLASCRPVAVPLNAAGGLDLAAIDPSDAARALVLWVNSPSNPTGALDDLGAVAAWGRANGVPVFSDECYVEFTWDGPGRTILEHGLDGVVAVHSLSKRSNLAGYRAGFVAGDPLLVAELLAVRRHAGMIMPAPVQAAMVTALGDETHVGEQRARYLARRTLLRQALLAAGFTLEHSEAGLYLWASRGEDCWATVQWLAERGILVAPGAFYGPAGAQHVRIALTATDERVAAAVERLSA
jgi:aspartate/methionine/tyrosine aminotransferase